MAHFAVLDGNNIVTAVHVVADADCLDGSDNESEAVGITFCEALWGAGAYQSFKQTSYNTHGGKHYDNDTGLEDSGTPLRKQYAEIGDTYDAAKDKYIKPTPFVSWTLNADDDWESPLGVQPHAVGKSYNWDEAGYQSDNSIGWVESDLVLE